MRPESLLGVYDADGGLRGEAAYLLGRLLGTRHCSLCDVTHSPVRRKPAWDALVADLGIPFRLAHRNELSVEEAAAVAGGLPAVLAVARDGLWVVLGPEELEEAAGDVDRFGVLLREALGRLT